MSLLQIIAGSWRRPEPPRATPLRRGATFQGIGQAAEALGVHRVHLWLVLTGRRQSGSLLRRYAALQRRRAP